MNQISSLLKNNLPAKILSVFAAVVLWVFVMNEQNPAVNNTMKVALAGAVTGGLVGSGIGALFKKGDNIWLIYMKLIIS